MKKSIVRILCMIVLMIIILGNLCYADVIMDGFDFRPSIRIQDGEVFLDESNSNDTANVQDEEISFDESNSNNITWKQPEEIPSEPLIEQPKNNNFVIAIAGVGATLLVATSIVALVGSNNKKIKMAEQVSEPVEEKETNQPIDSKDSGVNDETNR